MKEHGTDIPKLLPKPSRTGTLFAGAYMEVFTATWESALEYRRLKSALLSTLSVALPHPRGRK
jgi:hypothetical protein